MRVRLIGAGVVSLAVASVVVSVSVAAVIFRDPVGDARLGWCTPHNAEPCPSSFADITSVRVSQTARTVTVAVRLGSRCAGTWPRDRGSDSPVCTRVALHVNSDRNEKTGANDTRPYLDTSNRTPVGTDFSMERHGGGGGAVWEGSSARPPADMWQTRITPTTVTFTLDRHLLDDPATGLEPITVWFTVRSFQIGMLHDRSPDSGWHTYTLRPVA